MVRDQHQRAAREGAPHAAGGVGDDEDLDAEFREHPRRQTGNRRGMALIQMKAPRLDNDGHAFERAGHQLALMPGHARFRKPGNCAVRNPDRGIDFIGKKSKA